MRIIGGRFRSRRLQSDKSGQVRPTSGTLREALFNIVGSQISDAEVLDICAGTGAVGLEALSRGAAHATFIEQSKSTLKILNANIASLDVSDMTRIWAGDAVKVCNRLIANNRQFDLVFVDPPYFQKNDSRPALSEQILALSHALLKDQGNLFLEEGTELPLDQLTVPHLQLVAVRSYGDAMLYHYIKEQS